MEDKGYTIRCGSHTYITLEYNGKFIFAWIMMLCMQRK